MTSDENSDLFSLVHTMMSKVDSITGSTLLAIHNGDEGAGQEVPHVHVHLIPRSKSDSLQDLFIVCLIHLWNYLILKLKNIIIY